MKYKNFFKVICNYFLNTEFKIFPLRILVEPTNHCNLKCIICPHSRMKRKKGYMKISLFKKIVDETKDYSLECGLTCIDEPLLHKEVYNMIQYAKSNNCYVSLYTNLTLLNENNTRKILDSKLDKIVFTMGGTTKKTFEKIRVGANFQ